MTRGTVLLAAALLTAVQPPVDAFQQKPSAVLTGTLLSDDGRPVEGAIVSIVGTDKPGVRATTTNGAGEFSIEGLPASSFVVWSAKAGFLTSYYGSKDPGRGPATPVTLANGQRLTLSMTMRRGAAIGGRITDSAERPLSQVSVQVRAVSSLDTASPQTSKTDADGRYLIFGLAPGEYIVEALAPRVEGQVLAFAPTFFPGVPVIDQAVKIAVTAGEQSDDVAFTLYPAARVSGKVVVVNSQPMSGVSVALVPTEPSGAKFPSVPVSDTGEFSIPGVIPGTYALWARWDSNSSAQATGPDGRTLWGENDVVVNGPSVSGVILNLQPGVRVSGTIRLNPAPATPAMETLRFTLLPQVSSTAALTGRLSVTPDLAGNFVFPSVPAGPYDLRIAAGQVRGSPADTWVITSAIASDKDVADSTLDIRPGAATSGVVITLTETEISGTVLDASGQPTTKFPLLFFSVDRAFWTPGSRRVRTVQPAADATFRVGGLPPGEYFVVGYPSLDADAPIDAVDLNQFVGVAGRITIASGEKRRVDVSLASPPDSGVGAGGRADFADTWILTRAAAEGLANSQASQLHVGTGADRLVISPRRDGLRITSHYSPGGNHTVEYGFKGEPVRNSFFLGTSLPASPAPPAEVTSWWQGNTLVSTIDVFLPGESIPRHYVETMSISPEGILGVRIERVGFPDTRTMFYRKVR